jgi:hypothetical protein
LLPHLTYRTMSPRERRRATSSSVRRSALPARRSTLFTAQQCPCNNDDNLIKAQQQSPHSTLAHHPPQCTRSTITVSSHMTLLTVLKTQQQSLLHITLPTALKAQQQSPHNTLAHPPPQCTQSTTTVSSHITLLTALKTQQQSPHNTLAHHPPHCKATQQLPC